MCLYRLLDTLSVLSYTVTVLSESTYRPVMVQYLVNTTGYRQKPTVLERKKACHKYPGSDMFPSIKTGSLQVFDCRVGNITAGQAKNTPQAIKRNRQSGYSNRQSGKRVGQDGLILPSHGFSAMKSLCKVSRFVQFIIWYLASDGLHLIAFR